MNSIPLSHLFLGLPFSQIAFSCALITFVAGKDIETYCNTLSLSSIMFSTRNIIPHSITSLTKSSDQIVLGSEGCFKEDLTLAARRFFKRTQFS